MTGSIRDSFRVRRQEGEMVGAVRFELTIQIFPRKVPSYWVASCLSSVTDGGIDSASYAYLTNSSLVDNVTFMQMT